MKKRLAAALGFLGAFLLWTAGVSTVDVQPIGPLGSEVGFAALNRIVHRLTGVHMALYELTDLLSLIPLGFVLGFALLGLAQWIRRGSLRRVDRSILVLGGFYGIVLAVYALFEVWAVNDRPVLIDGAPEASYPSSTTVLALTVLPTAILQLRGRIKSPPVRRCAAATLAALSAFMVVGRFLSGVHWASDIIGGILLSAGLVLLYASLTA